MFWIPPGWDDIVSKKCFVLQHPCSFKPNERKPNCDIMRMFRRVGGCFIRLAFNAASVPLAASLKPPPPSHHPSFAHLRRNLCHSCRRTPRGAVSMHCGSLSDHSLGSKSTKIGWNLSEHPLCRVSGTVEYVPQAL